jgi:TolB-like protein
MSGSGSFCLGVLQHSIFISYSRDDEKEAKHLLALLRKEGYTVWIDQEALVGASIWSDEIVQNIKNCQLFIAMLSKSSVASPSVAKEIALAAEYGKVILPVELGSVQLPERFEYALAGIQYTSYEDEDGILRAVESQLAKIDAGTVTSTEHRHGHAYDHGHPHGRRHRRLRRKTKRVAYSSAAVLLFAFALFIYARPHTVPTSEISDNSVAVLPFATLNMDRDSTRSMDIFSDELISRLSADQHLSVASVTISAPYRDSRLNAAAIGSELGKRFIVEGLVRKSSDVYYISVHLFDTKNGGEIWEETYSGNGRVLFPIREQLCAGVLGNLMDVTNKERSIHEAEQNVKAHPNDAQAYARLAHEIAPHDKRRSFELWVEAIKHDSSNLGYYLNAGITAERVNEDAKAFGRVALPLAWAPLAQHPDSVNLAVNYLIALDLSGESARAGAMYDSLLSLHPTNERLAFNAACCYARQAKADHAVDLLEKLLSLNPGKRGEVKYDPDFDNIRSNPRYLALMHGVGQ